MELQYIIAARLHLLHRWNCPWDFDAVPSKQFIGYYGELVAASYLRAHGVRILRRNFRFGKRGELDIVCRHGDALVACEVKSTASPASGAPIRKINTRKRQLIRHGLDNWLMLLGRTVPTRFDIIEIQLPGRQRPQIIWKQKAFTYTEGAAWASSHAQ